MLRLIGSRFHFNRGRLTPGPDRLPVFYFDQRKLRYRLPSRVLVGPLSSDPFAVIARFRPDPGSRGFLLAAPDQTTGIVKFGLGLNPSPTSPDLVDLGLWLPLPLNVTFPGFSASDLDDKWTELVFVVKKKSVTLYVNCTLHGRVNIKNGGGVTNSSTILQDTVLTIVPGEFGRGFLVCRNRICRILSASLRI